MGWSYQLASSISITSLQSIYRQLYTAGQMEDLLSTPAAWNSYLISSGSYGVNSLGELSSLKQKGKTEVSRYFSPMDCPEMGIPYLEKVNYRRANQELENSGNTFRWVWEEGWGWNLVKKELYQVAEKGEPEKNEFGEVCP